MNIAQFVDSTPNVIVFADDSSLKPSNFCNLSYTPIPDLLPSFARQFPYLTGKTIKFCPIFEAIVIASRVACSNFSSEVAKRTNFILPLYPRNFSIAYLRYG